MYKKTEEDFDYNFNVNQEGIYSILIEVSASKNQFLKVELDEIILRGIITSRKDQYYSIPPDWNGNLLKGTTKIVILVARLSKGNHVLKFKPKGEIQIIAEPKVNLLSASELATLLENIQSEEKNRQEWITIALIDLPLKELEVTVTCQKRFWESDDVGLIIDDKIQKNPNPFLWWGKNWYWQGRKLKGTARTDAFSLKLARGLHYVELWADKTPVLNTLKLDLGTDFNEDKKENATYIGKDKEWWINWKDIRKYTYGGISNRDDYNRYDEVISDATAYWNCEFFSQECPPQEPLDPNLVKEDNLRHWFSWRDAVKRYGPLEKEYVDNVLKNKNYV